MAQFVELFHRYGYIYRPFNGAHWLSADECWKLTDTEILKAISCAHNKFIGTRSGKTTRFAVLDIDAKSKYHNKSQLDRLLKVLTKAGLGRCSLYRSSFSGGWHLYIFFDEQISSADLRKQLVHLLSLSDFVVADGVLEVFPNPGNGSKGKGLRLPLQPGWAWLDKRTLDIDHYREEMSATKALEFFLDCLESDANSFKDFRQLKAHVRDLEGRKTAAASHGVAPASNNVVPLRRRETPAPTSEFSSFVTSVFGQIPPGMKVDTWYKGRQYHLEGLSGPSQRADAIYTLGHYFFYGDPGRDLPALGYGYAEERKWAIREFLDARHNGHSEDLNKGRADAIAQVDRATSWLPSHKKTDEPIKYSPVVPISWIRENANRKSNARQRIADALDRLKKLNRSFTTVELQESAGCARKTLYNHEDIWRQDYEDLAAGFFETCLHEYNAVVEAACSASKPPSTAPEKIVPPGLLAARRVVYELSMRSIRDIQTKQKTALRSSEASEMEWRGNVAALTKEEPSELPVPKLKSLLVVLANYLSLAPYEEDAVPLLSFITRLRQELTARSYGPVPPCRSG
ncbi:MAG TPA: hypothetical protein V6C86_09985 [Oculatellaceae cyanobacterium]